MDLDQDRLLRVVMISLAGCVTFFGVWMYIDGVSPLAPRGEAVAHWLGVLLRMGVASPLAAIAAGAAFAAARFCWPGHARNPGRVSGSA